MSVEFLGRFLPVFYNTAAQPDAWQHALDQICEEMQVGSAVVQMLGREGDHLVPHWNARDSISTARSSAHDSLVNNQDNPRLIIQDPNAEIPDSGVYRDEESLAPSALRSLRERLQAIGLGRAITLGLRYDEDRSLCLILHRRCDDGRDFNAEQVQLLQLLTPHLKQTVSMSEQLGNTQRSVDHLSQCVDQLGTGVMLLDDKGHMRWGNAMARRMLERSSNISVINGRIRCQSTENQQKLTDLLSRASAFDRAGQQAVTVLGQPWDDPLHLLLRRLPGSPAAGGTLALYLSDSVSQTPIAADDLMHLFSLTPAEAHLAAALCQGKSINDYAEDKGVSTGTVRIHLKNLFAKLGTNRQPDLVRLLSASVVAKMHPTPL
ncbi:helix-turn-helix transcriptional regulator [Pseudomaricurvus alkylphenolicus]|uniref:helix-turn-helix transcriptional regulator n=1 Tax=Pseudomaricurvus alkylphenolicus TaxID=1306991 RepID=UPI001421C19D|nr:helix-turn-helix transcriptional regulator [Pseudomaricurvus alkylphenolicus]NIB43383.1 helix-turn-helix transcriptional regulator [Pseudomaricurvus alkylphenolicus]